MDRFSHYWQLAKITGAGRYYCKVFPHIQTWFLQEVLPGLREPADEHIQAFLIDRWRLGGVDADMAELSLRCTISHHIHSTCRQLARQFGQHYRFRTTDLLPYVLDDNGRFGNDYCPFTLNVLERYCTSKAKLSTWTMHLTKNHRGLNEFLLDQGLYRISNWAILNDTTPRQLHRIFQNFYQMSEAECQSAQVLLQRYHQVYRRDRNLKVTRRRQGTRCQVPSQAQLREMVMDQSPDQVFAQLEAMATKLRHYRIYSRSGNIQTLNNVVYLDELDNFSLDHCIDVENLNVIDDGDEQASFSQQYQRHLKSCLQQAIQQALQQRVKGLRRRSDLKAQAYIEAVRLFHQEGLSMGAIATRLSQTFSPHLTFSSQVQITRLLKLKELRAEIRQLTLDNIKDFVYEVAGHHASAQRLAELRPTIETILAHAIDQIIGEAAAEAQRPQRQQPASRLAITLCEVVETLAA